MSDKEGYFDMSLSLFGTEVFRFRLDVDDFKVKWVLVAVLSAFAIVLLLDQAQSVLHDQYPQPSQSEKGLPTQQEGQ